jgi:hypothetical protein
MTAAEANTLANVRHVYYTSGVRADDDRFEPARCVS